MKTANRESAGVLMKKRHSDHTTMKDSTISTRAIPMYTHGRMTHFQYHSEINKGSFLSTYKDCILEALGQSNDLLSCICDDIICDDKMAE